MTEFIYKHDSGAASSSSSPNQNLPLLRISKSQQESADLEPLFQDFDMLQDEVEPMAKDTDTDNTIITLTFQNLPAFYDVATTVQLWLKSDTSDFTYLVNFTKSIDGAFAHQRSLMVCVNDFPHDRITHYSEFARTLDANANMVLKFDSGPLHKMGVQRMALKNNIRITKTINRICQCCGKRVVSDSSIAAIGACEFACGHVPNGAIDVLSPIRTLPNSPFTVKEHHGAVQVEHNYGIDPKIIRNLPRFIKYSEQFESYFKEEGALFSSRDRNGGVVFHYSRVDTTDFDNTQLLQKVTVELHLQNTRLGDVYSFTYKGKTYQVCLHPKRTLFLGTSMKPWTVDAYIELSPTSKKSKSPIRITDPSTMESGETSDAGRDFVAADSFLGALSGYVFKTDERGLGYYRDTTSTPTATSHDADNTATPTATSHDTVADSTAVHTAFEDSVANTLLSMHVVREE